MKEWGQESSLQQPQSLIKASPYYSRSPVLLQSADDHFFMLQHIYMISCKSLSVISLSFSCNCVCIATCVNKSWPVKEASASLFVPFL